MHPTEQELRTQLAATYRILHHFGWDELIWTHSTLRLPGPDHHFLINPYGLRFDEVTASNLVKVDPDGNIIGDPSQDQEINPAGFVIHSAIHMLRPEVQCIVHTHTTAGMAIAATQTGLLPISMYALGFHGQVSYHDFEGPSLNFDERDRLGRNLAKNNVLILRNHGLLTCGETVPQAVVRMFRLERACQVQLAAHATGAPLVIPSQEVCDLSASLSDKFLSTKGGDGYSRRPNPEFDALVRLMDKIDPSYRD